jgi:subtilisin family serine protease
VTLGVVHLRLIVVRAVAVLALTLGLTTDLSAGPATAGDVAARRVTPRSPALHAVHAVPVWSRYTGSGVTVAVIDSGVKGSVANLRGRVLAGVDMVDPRRSNGWHDVVAAGGHGTGVASIIAGTGRGNGVYGVAPQAVILPVRIVNDRGHSPDARVGVAIRWAVDHGADVINLSLGTSSDGRQAISGKNRRAEHAATRYAVQQGVIVVAAAGNDGPDNTGKVYPAAFPQVIAVGGTNRSGEHAAEFSERGAWVDLAAPAVDVWNTNTNGSRGIALGTSLASPAVAGAVALMLSANPDLSPSAVRRLLKATGHDLGPAGIDPEIGAGLVDVAAAVRASSARQRSSDVVTR